MSPGPGRHCRGWDRSRAACTCSRLYAVRPPGLWESVPWPGAGRASVDPESWRRQSGRRESRRCDNRSLPGRRASTGRPWCSSDLWSALESLFFYSCVYSVVTASTRGVCQNLQRWPSPSTEHSTGIWESKHNNDDNNDNNDKNDNVSLFLYLFNVAD